VTIDAVTIEIRGVSEETVSTGRSWPRCPCTRFGAAHRRAAPTAQLFVHANSERDTSLFSCYLLELWHAGLRPGVQDL